MSKRPQRTIAIATHSAPLIITQNMWTRMCNDWEKQAEAVLDKRREPQEQRWESFQRELVSQVFSKLQAENCTDPEAAYHYLDRIAGLFCWLRWQAGDGKLWTLNGRLVIW